MLAVGHQLGRFARIDRIDGGARVTKPPDRVHGNSETDRGWKRAEPVPGPTDPVRYRPPPAQRPHQHRSDQHENRGRYASFHEWSSIGPPRWPESDVRIRRAKVVRIGYCCTGCYVIAPVPAA
jgi:hypothetical protein